MYVLTWVCRVLFQLPQTRPLPGDWKQEYKGQRVEVQPKLEDYAFVSENYNIYRYIKHKFNDNNIIFKQNIYNY